MTTTVQSQTITPELRQWIIDQARAGHKPDAVLKSMTDSGWQEDVAIAALEETLQGFLKEHAKANGLPEPVIVPEPMLLDSPSRLQVADREVRVLMHMRNPRVAVFGGFLSDEECDEMVRLAAPRMKRSETVDVKTGGSEVHEARTSRGMFFERGEGELIRRIETRIAALLNWPVEFGEGLQVLHYLPGAEYRPHYDYFDPNQPGSAPILKRGGQRVGTLLMYLNTPEAGGGTTFPDVNLEIAPIKGNAAFFSYDRPHPMTRSLHGGAPVVRGEKWVSTKWLRQGKFV